MIEKSTETANPSLWKSMNSILTAVESSCTELGLHMGETVVKLGLSDGPLAVGPGSIPGT